MSSLKLIIGNKNYSSWSLRPWVVLKEIGLSFEEVLIPLYTETTYSEILKYSPSGKVPALIDGDVVVWESLAICDYLHDKFPEKELWPKNNKARALARSVSAEMHAGFQSLRENLPMVIRKMDKDPQVMISAEAQEDIQRILQIWNECRKKFGDDGKFLFGSFSVADAMFLPVVMRFKIYGVTLDPVSSAYVQSMLDLPSVKEWISAAKIEPYTIAAFE